MPKLLPSVLPQRSYARRVFVPILAAIALICGPLAAMPAQAANAAISGTVTDSDGVGLPGISVRAWTFSDGDWDYSHLINTDANGTYSLSLPPDTYHLEFTGSDEYATEYYDDKTSVETANPVELGVVNETGKDAELALNQTISGTVTNATGELLDNINVAAWKLVGTQWQTFLTVQTNINGEYLLRLAPNTTYRLEFWDGLPTFGQYATEFYEDRASIETAIPVVVGAVDVTGKDAELGLQIVKGTPTISGTAKVGSMLTASDGTWDPAPVGLSRQWLRNGVVIVGGTATTYAPVAGDVGATISVKITGAKTGYTTIDATSAGTSPVVAADPPYVAPPRFGASFTGGVKGGKKKATVSVRVRFANVKTKKVKGSVYVYEGARMVKKGSFKKGKGKFKVKAKKGIHTYTVIFFGGANYGTKTFVRTVRVK